jgi:hypothetical protein
LYDETSIGEFPDVVRYGTLAVRESVHQLPLAELLPLVELRTG